MPNSNISPSFTGDIPAVEETINSNCVIHFRPKSNWDGSNYGFDWVRIGDSGMKADKHKINHHYANLMGKYYGRKTFATPTLIGGRVPNTIPTTQTVVCDDPNGWTKMLDGSPATFKHELTLYSDYVNRYFHKRLVISWKMGQPSICPNSLDADIAKEIDKTQYTYYAPVMTLMLNKEAELVMHCELNPSDPPPTKIDIEEKLNSGETACFSFLEGTETKANPENNKKYPLKIKCVSTFGSEKLIEAYATYPDGSKKLCGKLRVLANNNVLDLKVLFINVELTVDGSAKTGSLSNTELNHIKRIFAQSMINLVDTTEPNFAITSATLPAGIDGKIQNLLSSVNSTTGSYFPKSKSTNAAREIDRAYKKHLEDTGQAQLYLKHLKVYLVDVYAQSSMPSGQWGRKNGVTFDGHGVVFIFKGTDFGTVAHEVMHAIGGPHTFVGKETAPNATYTFQARTTDNILDYSHQLASPISRVTTWQWQWNLARSFARKQAQP